MKHVFQPQFGIKIFELVRSWLILWGFLMLGEWLSDLTQFGIPASIYGLLLLFLGLTTQIIKLNWIYFGANLLIRYMAILFIPVSVGIIQYGDLLSTQGKALLIPNILSTCLCMVCLGFFADYILSLNSFARLRKKLTKKRTNSKKN